MPNVSPLHETAARSGAIFGEEEGGQTPLHFGRPDEEYRRIWEHAGMFDRSPRGKVTLTGTDAQRFLHNLCTNDILNLQAGAGCEAFLTTNKAKAIAYVLVFHQAEPDRLWLDTDPGRASVVSGHLDRYLISERVEIADRTTEYGQLYVAGPQAQEYVRVALGLASLPDQIHEASKAGGVWVRRRDLMPALPGFDVICPSEKAPAVWESLAGRGVSPAGSQTFDVLRVEAGVPVFHRDIDEERMVVEVGRGTRAISYTKGCYLGQETIVMARDRGHVNRFLVGLRVEGATPVSPGTVVRAGEKEVGQVTSGVMSPRVGSIALAYVRREQEQEGTALTVAEGGRKAVVATLPFGDAI
jgi:tRNA-modifying protein YgfZ